MMTRQSGYLLIDIVRAEEGERAWLVVAAPTSGMEAHPLAHPPPQRTFGLR